MMMRALVLQILYDGGVFARLDALEKRVAELEGGSAGDVPPVGV
jgi:hypothetical protein